MIILYIWDEKTNGFFSVCGCNLCSCSFSVCRDLFPAFVSSVTLLLLLCHLWVSLSLPSFFPIHHFFPFLFLCSPTLSTAIVLTVFTSSHAKHLPVLFLHNFFSPSTLFSNPLIFASLPIPEKMKSKINYYKNTINKF